MATANLDGVTIHYEISGPSHAPVVVLSNSLGTTFNMWDAQLPTFNQHLRVLRYDTRGHGQSTVPPGPYTLATLGNDVLHLLDHLTIAEASICGVSLGGMTALWLALHSPGRICRIVAANTAVRIGTADGWNARIEQALQHGMRSLTPGILDRWYTAPFRTTQPAAIAATAHMLESTSAEGYSACCAAVRDMDQTADIGRITIPTLLISGTEDSVTPPSDLQLLKHAIPHAQYVELHAAHLSNIEATAAFNAAALPFLTVSEGAST